MAIELVLVADRGGARELRQLSMRCDAKEIPDDAEGHEASSYWIAKTAASGRSSLCTDGVISEGEAAFSVEALSAFAIVEGRLLGIVSPDAADDCAVWLAAPLSSLTCSAAGSQGAFKKRPTTITLEAKQWKLVLSDVAELFRRSGRYQSGQEAGLLKALGH